MSENQQLEKRNNPKWRNNLTINFYFRMETNLTLPIIKWEIIFFYKYLIGNSVFINICVCHFDTFCGQLNFCLNSCTKYYSIIRFFYEWSLKGMIGKMYRAVRQDHVQLQIYLSVYILDHHNWLWLLAIGKQDPPHGFLEKQLKPSPPGNKDAPEMIIVASLACMLGNLKYF